MLTRGFEKLGHILRDKEGHAQVQGCVPSQKHLKGPQSPISDWLLGPVQEHVKANIEL